MAGRRLGTADNRLIPAQIVSDEMSAYEVDAKGCAVRRAEGQGRIGSRLQPYLSVTGEHEHGFVAAPETGALQEFDPRGELLERMIEFGGCRNRRRGGRAE